MNHTLSVIVEDKPGVLARVSSLLARRGFNIHSLAVGPSHEEGMSRMTIVVEAPELEQVKKQLHKLINVVRISEFAAESSIEREIMLVRVAGGAGKRGEILEIAAIFDAIAVDVGHSSISFQIAGDPRKVNDFLELVRPYGLIELVKSGRVALAREAKGRPAKLRAVN
ncbi:MAG TPA: acetolactate synthase small subunit [Acidimicrobiia bacterium]|jgi:acetolactate synthase-1/3 small subunit|nr:acetolactate synthase small subunit [Acidimicrobiia bacterium]